MSSVSENKNIIIFIINKYRTLQTDSSTLLLSAFANLPQKNNVLSVLSAVWKKICGVMNG